MSILTVKNLEKWFGIQQIFQDVSFEIGYRDRIALIGNNGEGKTTLLNVITGKEDFDSGQIIFAGRKTIGILNQSVELNKENTLYQEMLTSFESLFRLKSKMEECEKKLSIKEIYTDEKKLNQVMKRYGKLTEVYEMNGGYDIDTRINQVLFGLSFKESQFNQIIGTFSGGEKTKIKLAKLLVYNPDLLLLDEPSNHLDINTIEWLEKYIEKYSGSVLLVSHDRHFMDKTVNKVFELNNCKIKEYAGNYTKYTKCKKEESEQQKRDYQRMIKEKSKLENQISKFKKIGKFSQIRSREKMLESMDIIDKPTVEKRINFSIVSNKEKVGTALKVRGLKKSFNKETLFENISFDVNWGDKIAVLGPNGAGKSTLLKILLGVMDSTSGIVNFDSSKKLGYFAQEHDNLTENFTLLEEIGGKLGLNNYDSRSLLAQFLFYENDVNKKIRNLSGGERSRVTFAKLLSSDLNFLIMDEPTNHLDINSREVLENALLNFNGTLIFVSHDRYFVNKIANKIIRFDNKNIQIEKLVKDEKDIITKNEIS
ncbi:MAG: ABC-F family ATP-binding cassette domain-containing protein [Firmicutes bacterium]|nr:ABC-F family ATP-binding cassette domain-containing protein [Bacillota bacterium]